MGMLQVAVIINFIVPLLILFLFVKPVLKTVLVPEFLSEQVYDVVRAVLIVFLCLLRIFSFRDEVQFTLDNSFQLIKQLVVSKRAELFQYVKLRIEENFFNTWYNIYQHTTTITMPLILMMLYCSKELTWYRSDEREKTLAYFDLPAANRTKQFYPVFELEKYREKFGNHSMEDGIHSKFSFLALNERTVLTEYVTELTQKGVVPQKYYSALLQFAVIWYFVAVLFMSTFGLLYYRKFRALD